MSQAESIADELQERVQRRDLGAMDLIRVPPRPLG